MFHRHEETTRVRMFALLGVRMLAVILLLRGGLNLVNEVFNMWSFLSNGGFGFFYNRLLTVAFQCAGWFFGSFLLIIIQRPLVRWLVPMPPHGCVNCGYPQSRENSGPCPECGVTPAPQPPADR